MIFQKVLNFFSSNDLFCTSFHSEPILNGYLVLEDLNQSYVHPCILDVKFGTRTCCTSFLLSFTHLNWMEHLHRKSCGITHVSVHHSQLSLWMCVCGICVISLDLLHNRITFHKATTGSSRIKNETIVVRDRHILLWGQFMSSECSGEASESQRYCVTLETMQREWKIVKSNRIGGSDHGRFGWAEGEPMISWLILRIYTSQIVRIHWMKWSWRWRMELHFSAMQSDCV